MIWKTTPELVTQQRLKFNTANKQFRKINCSLIINFLTWLLQLLYDFSFC